MSIPLAATAAAIYRQYVSEKGRLAYNHQNIKSLDTSSLAASSLDEKQRMYENEKAQDIRANAHYMSQAFSQTSITKALNDLLAFSNTYLALSFGLQRQKAPMLLKAAVVEPESALVKANLTVTQPLTSQQLRVLLDSIFPQTYHLLETGQQALAGDFSQTAQRIHSLFGDYVQKLNSLETLLRQGGLQAIQPPQQKESIPLYPLFYFDAAQVDAITDYVNQLSALSLALHQSSESLCNVPELADLRFAHSLVSGLFSLASASIFYFTGAAVAVAGLAGALIFISGLVSFWAYGKYSKAEAKLWQARIKEMTYLTKQFEYLRDKAMSSQFTVQRADINRNTVAINSHSQEIIELKAQNQRLEEQLRISEEEKQEKQQLKVTVNSYIEAQSVMLVDMQALKKAVFGNNPPQVSVAAMPISKDTTNAIA